MKLGVKVNPNIFLYHQEYRRELNRFQVWYVEAKYMIYKPAIADYIYRKAYENKKEMYGYFLISSRFHIPNELKEIKLRKINDLDVIKYLRKIIKRYPLIKNWELCHEAINDKGEFRKGNIYYRNLGEGWQYRIYELIKNEFPDKKFFYSDYCRQILKANSVIDFVNGSKHIDGYNFQCHCDILSSIPLNLIRHIYTNIEKNIVSLENTVWKVAPYTKSDFQMPRKNKQRYIKTLIKKGIYNTIYINDDLAEKIQGNVYKKYMNVAREYEIDIFGFLSLTDLKEDVFSHFPYQIEPGLMNDNLTKKSFYESIFS